MAGRILSMQRQARELGRLRTGYTDTSRGKARPVRSNEWIISSHADHYVQAAADAWGGSVEQWQPQGGGAPQFRVITQQAALDAILPPGDPLSQSLEMWSNGGCTRRCDGVTELLSDAPCVCRGKFGDSFHEQRTGTVCSTTTRLNVFLPDLPDVGVWRMETHSFYAAQEIAGAVDLIKGAVGHEVAIPIRLRIEQRMRKANGETKKFPVVVVELRGITTGQVLGGSVLGAIAAPERQALAAAPAESPVVVQIDVESVRRAVEAVDNLDDLRELWGEAKAAGLLDRVMERAREFSTPTSGPDESDDDSDDLYAQIMRKVPDSLTTTSMVEEDFKKVTGAEMETATSAQLRTYLDHLVTQ